MKQIFVFCFAYCLLIIIGIGLSSIFAYKVYKSKEFERERMYIRRFSRLSSDIFDVFSTLSSEWIVTTALSEFDLSNIDIFERLARSSQTFFGGDTIVYAKRVEPNYIQEFQKDLYDIYGTGMNVKYSQSDNVSWPIFFIYPYIELYIGCDVFVDDKHIEALNRAVTRGRTSFVYDVFLQNENEFGVLVTQPVIRDNNVIGGVIRAFTIENLFSNVPIELFLGNNGYPRITIRYLYPDGLSATVFDTEPGIFLDEQNSIQNVYNVSNETSVFVSLSEYKRNVILYGAWGVFKIGVILTICLSVILIIFGYRTRLWKLKNSRVEFISCLSHGLRTPMNGILGISDMLSSRQDLCDSIKDDITDIRSCSRDMVSVIDDILDLSKIDTGIMHLNPVQFKIWDTLSDTIRDTKNSHVEIYGKKDIYILQTCQAGFPHEVLADKCRFVQIVRNLVSNSIKFTSSGFIEVHASFSNFGKDKYMLCISIKDTGIGIDPEGVSKLFSPFQNSDDGTRLQGTGLGLTVSKRLALLMGGDVKCTKSVIKKGSEFQFNFESRLTNTHLLVNEPNKYLLSARSSFTKDSYDYDDISNRVNNKCVLIVDDNMVNRIVIKKIVNDIGISKVDVCEDGQAAVELTRGRMYDIIFMDMMMPVMDGITSCKLIRKEGINVCTPIIFITANASRDANESCLKCGGDEYMTKPVTKRTLSKVILRYVNDDV